MKNSFKLFLLLLSFLFLGCGNTVLPPENYYVNCGDKIFHIGEENKIQMPQWTYARSGVVTLRTREIFGPSCYYNFDASSVRVDDYGAPFITIPANHCYGRIPVTGLNQDGNFISVTVNSYTDAGLITDTVFSVWTLNP